MMSYGECYCGCCGRECSMAEMWCKDCMSHVIPSSDSYRPYWERTYFAQHREVCPFQGEPIKCDS
jgi:hypothetical protein